MKQFTPALKRLGKTALRVSLTSVILVGTFGGIHHFAKNAAQLEVDEKVNKLNIQITLMEKQAELRRSRLEETRRLETTILKAMLITGAKLSDIQRANLISIIARVADETFNTYEQKETWVAVLANESRFNVNAESPAGAVGLGQVMPKSAKYYSERCGLPVIQPDDLTDPTINAFISACIFKVMLKSTNDSSILAMVAYNAGEFSKDVTRLDRLTNINQESANYIAKITRFLEKARASGEPTEKK